MKKGRAEGRNLVEVLEEATQKATKGDLSLMPKLFKDQEFGRGMLALMTYRGEWQKLSETLQTTSGGTVVRDLVQVTKDAQASVDRLSNSWQRFIQAASRAADAGGVSSGLGEAGKEFQSIAVALERINKAYAEGGLSGAVKQVAGDAADRVRDNRKDWLDHRVEQEDGRIAEMEADNRAFRDKMAREGRSEADIASTMRLRDEAVRKARLRRQTAQTARAAPMLADRVPLRMGVDPTAPITGETGPVGIGTVEFNKAFPLDLRRAMKVPLPPSRPANVPVVRGIDRIEDVLGPEPAPKPDRFSLDPGAAGRTAMKTALEAYAARKRAEAPAITARPPATARFDLSGPVAAAPGGITRAPGTATKFPLTTSMLRAAPEAPLAAPAAPPATAAPAAPAAPPAAAAPPAPAAPTPKFDADPGAVGRAGIRAALEAFAARKQAEVPAVVTKPPATGRFDLGGPVAAGPAGIERAPGTATKFPMTESLSKTRDGRNYAFDPEVLTARFTSDAVDIAVDTNHGLALRATRGEDVEPIGYAAELQARPDGTWARINWLDPEAAAAVVRKHRYVSPTFFPDATGQAVWLHSISLVSTPALSMPALAFAQGPAMETLGAVAQALGLPVTADEAAYLSAIAGLASAHDQLTALQAANHQSAVTSLMDGALRARKIVPSEREEYVALCSTAEGFAHVQRLFARKVPMLQGSGLDGRTAPSAGDIAETPQMLAARATRYREQQAHAGATLSQSEAITFAHANPTAGR